MSSIPESVFAQVSAQVPGALFEGARVTVGVSGGVDSAVAALLLKECGAKVCGVFMRNWRDDDEAAACHDKADFYSAAAVADALEIDLEVADFAREYRERVFAPFLQSLREGDTPNPDVLCNAEIKFDAFRAFAEKNGADFVATGHYARVRRAVQNAGVSNDIALLKGEDSAKDQSYFFASADAVAVGAGGLSARRNDEDGRARSGARGGFAELESEGQRWDLFYRGAAVSGVFGAVYSAGAGGDGGCGHRAGSRAACGAGVLHIGAAERFGHRRGGVGVVCLRKAAGGECFGGGFGRGASAVVRGAGLGAEGALDRGAGAADELGLCGAAAARAGSGKLHFDAGG